LFEVVDSCSTIEEITACRHGLDSWWKPPGWQQL